MLTVPGIHLTALTNGADHNAAPGLYLAAGSPVTWTYQVTNTGDVALATVSVIDDQGVTLSGPEGDTNGDGLLDLGETWTYTATGTAIAGQYTNIATARGLDSTGAVTEPVTASDADNYFGVAPGIQIVKHTNGTDNNTAPGLLVAAGSPVTWTYIVTNTGNIALANVTVVDDQGVVLDGPAGDANANNLLDVGETWTYTATGTAVTGQYSNSATATGADATGTVATPVASVDSEYYFGIAPAVHVITRTNGTNNNPLPGLLVAAGSTVTWAYTVTNSGNVPLAGVAVVDDRGVTVSGPSGDTNENALLDIGETWVYTASGTAIEGQYTNVGTVTAGDSTGTVAAPVTASDPDNYFGLAPGIQIVKLTNGTDNNAAPGLLVAPGTTLNFTYIVTNTGNAALANVLVSDSDPAVVLSGPAGDTNGDNKLDVGETWTYTATATAAAGPHASLATAAGTDAVGAPVTSADAEKYFGVQAAVQVVTRTNGANNNSLPGLLVAAGSAVTWTYTVTNTGNVPLAGVAVVDDRGVTVSGPSGDTNSDNLLDTDETWVYTASGTATAGQYTNVGTVTASDSTGTVSAPATASDADNYYGLAPGIHVIKRTNGTDNNAAPGLHLVPGSAITWTYVVTNTGNAALSNVLVNDSDPSLVLSGPAGDTNGDGKLDVGETWTYTATGTATAGQHASTATATATDAVGAPVTSTDAENYLGVNPAINVVTLTNGTEHNAAPGSYLAVGAAVTWTYRVTNTGNVPLKNVSVVDSKGVTLSAPTGDADSDGLLDAGETWVYTASGTAAAGQYTNTATATGADNTGTVATPVSDTDTDNYFGVAPAVRIVKLTNGTDNNQKTGPKLKVGSAIAWTYRVTNTGNVALRSIAVTDGQSGLTPVYASGDANSNGLLDLGETWIYTAAGTALKGQRGSSGKVSATDSTGAQTQALQASDVDYYYGKQGGLAALRRIDFLGKPIGSGVSGSSSARAAASSSSLASGLVDATMAEALDWFLQKRLGR